MLAFAIIGWAFGFAMMLFVIWTLQEWTASSERICAEWEQSNRRWKALCEGIIARAYGTTESEASTSEQPAAGAPEVP